MGAQETSQGSDLDVVERILAVADHARSDGSLCESHIRAIKEGAAEIMRLRGLAASAKPDAQEIVEQTKKAIVQMLRKEADAPAGKWTLMDQRETAKHCAELVEAMKLKVPTGRQQAHEAPAASHGSADSEVFRKAHAAETLVSLVEEALPALETSDKALHEKCRKLLNGELAWEGSWQPIETAPRDRMLILAAEHTGKGDWRIKIGYWDERTKNWTIFGASWKPTRWRPMLAPPLD